jgi:hypothetical protein
VSKPATKALSVVAKRTSKKARTTMKKSMSGSMEGKAGDSPSQLINARIKELNDWRGETLARVRILIKQAASLEDPSGLFNSSLEGNTRRAIDFHESDKIDEKALQALIRAAVALNISVRAAAGPVRSRKRPKSA